LHFLEPIGSLNPNQVMVVWIVFDDGETPENRVVFEKIEGNHGKYRGELREMPAASAPTKLTVFGLPVLPEQRIEKELLQPFLPGNVTIKLSLVVDKTVDGKTVPTVLDEEKIQVTVEPYYFGAFRTGIAAVFWPAVDYRYEAVVRPGSEQREIATATDRPPFANVEFVVGYTLYLPPHRTYPHENFWCDVWGIYLGFGLLEIDENTKNPVTAFKSYYAGVDFEPHENFSIVLAAVARQVDRLKSYQTIGQPLADSAEPALDDDWRFSGAILINLSPSLFKTAMKGGGF